MKWYTTGWPSMLSVVGVLLGASALSVQAQDEQPAVEVVEIEQDGGLARGNDAGVVVDPDVPTFIDETPAVLNPNRAANDVLGEVRLLAHAHRYPEALELLRSYRDRHPEDDSARRLELAIEVAQKEHQMRVIVGDLSRERQLVLGDPDYLIAKAAADRPVAARLPQVEFLVREKRYPEAIDACNAILADHPFDEATLFLKDRLLEEMIELQSDKLERAKALRNGEVLNEVVEASTMPRQPRPIPRTVLVFDEDLDALERARVMNRLKVRLPSFNFDNASVGDVLKDLFALSGMNYILLDEAISAQTLTIYLVDESVENILKTIQRMVDVNFNYQGGTVYVTNSENPVLVTEIIRLKSGITNVTAEPQLESVSGGNNNGDGGNNGGGGGGGGGIDLFGEGGDGGNGDSDLGKFLDQIPDLVEWPDDSTMYVEPKSNSLYVRSSPAAIAEVKRLLHALDFNSIMVRIDAKFVEVSDEAFRELGVDWKIGGFNTSGADGVLAGGVQSGGTSAADLFSNLGVLNNPALAQAAAGLIESGIAANALGVPAIATGTNPSGFSLGLIGAGNGMNPNFEVTLRALQGKGKANTLSEPSITTLSNSTGLIDISRDISFVEDIENRAVTSDVQSDNGNVITNTVNLPVPRFGTDSEGIRLRVVPSVARNSDVITLAIFPAVRELVGFRSQVVVNPQANGTNNEVQRPEFASRALATALHIRNGQTVVMGGLISERSATFRRGVPFLSDIPFAGQLFRTDTEEFERRKLLIFVTARIIDPSGASLNNEERVLRDTARIVLPSSVRAELERVETQAAYDVESAAEKAFQASQEARAGEEQSERSGVSVSPKNR